jgi:hypothetical protein
MLTFPWTGARPERAERGRSPPGRLDFRQFSAGAALPRALMRLQSFALEWLFKKGDRSPRLGVKAADVNRGGGTTAETAPGSRIAFHNLLRPQLSAVYCAHVVNSPNESTFMALKLAEEVSTQVPGDDFQALEDKVYRTIDMYKAAREARVVAERDLERVRTQLEEREEEVETLRREMVQLRREREEIRGRVEKMLHQIDTLSEEQAAS